MEEILEKISDIDKALTQISLDIKIINKNIENIKKYIKIDIDE